MFWKVLSRILCEFAIWFSELQADVFIYSKSLLKSLGTHVSEHFPNASYGVYPIEDDSKIALVVVANKYSPNNFW